MLRLPLALRLSEPTRRALARRARASGIDPSELAGDLLVLALPDALAEAARERLAEHLPSDAAAPPALTSGATFDLAQVGSRLADLDSEDGAGGLTV